jgi:hypothetical protein
MLLCDSEGGGGMIIERGRLFSHALGSPRHGRLSTEFEASEDANDELDASQYAPEYHN